MKSRIIRINQKQKQKQKLKPISNYTNGNDNLIIVNKKIDFALRFLL